MEQKNHEIKQGKRTMTSLADRLRDFFTKRPIPRSVIQVSSRYLSGLQFSPTEKKIKSHFILPLDEGMVRPSFDKKNITDASLLEKRLLESVDKLHLFDNKVCLLLPELSQRTFIFSLDSLPPSRQEREQIIRFRVKKQMPLLSEDVRLSFDFVKGENGIRVVTSLAKASVVKDFEDFFSKLRIKIRVVSTPLISLSNLVDRIKEQDFLLVNIEEDSFSLLAVVDSGISLYRQKPSVADSKSPALSDQKIRNIVQEIENTVNFVEDKEKRKIDSLLVRLGLLESDEDILAGLGENLNFSVREIGLPLEVKLTKREKRILSPSLGQVV